jgi:Spermine/spermidine synthase domain
MRYERGRVEIRALMGDRTKVPTTNPTASHPVQLFVLSAIALYFELLVVRWTNAYVVNVGFFTNFLVLASFVGLGSGFLLAKRAANLLPVFPLGLLIYTGLVYSVRPKLAIADSGALFWGERVKLSGDASTLPMTPEAFIAVAFFVVALLFVLLGQAIGRHFETLPPLRGYGANIAGSLLGAALFTANSFFLANPVVWFALVLGALAPFVWGHGRVTAIAYAASIAVLGLVYRLDVGSMWSPYYRTESRCAPDGDCWLSGNGIWGQTLARFKPQQSTPRTVVYGEGGMVRPRRYPEVLVIGSGGGNDVDVALNYGADHVDAVEINPLTVQLGSRLHPDKPYSSSKVTVTIDDGRAFLRRTDKKYDLIVYALPDSTGLVTSRANMRVESYLFTVEAFRSVLAHLKPDGLFAAYNNFREFWLIDKIAGMLQQAAGQPPLVAADRAATATLMVGPGLTAIQLKPPLPIRSAPPPATDDWPFFYLKSPHLPDVYVRSLAVIALLSTALVVGFAWFAGRHDAGGGGREPASEKPRPPLAHIFRLDGPMFFMGAAFMLLEAKSIVSFGLLFGTTWLTTALVIGAILLLVLAAIYINAHFAVRKVAPWIGLLAASLAVVYILPPEHFLLANPVLRYFVGAFAALSPVLFANVIFARLLRETKETPRSLASNLLGSVFGGIAEYVSLVVGYRGLLPVVAVFYTLAFALLVRVHRGLRSEAKCT